MGLIVIMYTCGESAGLLVLELTCHEFKPCLFPE